MKTLAAALLYCLVSAPAFAELTYTVRIQARTVAADASADPRVVALGKTILQAVVPDGSVELTIIVGDGVARVQWSKAMPGIPAGTVLLQRRDGGRVLVNTVDQTFWPAGMPDLYSLETADRPVVVQTPQGGLDLVAGIPAARSHLAITIPFREAREGTMVTGTPTDLPLEGEVWVTDRFASFATRELRSIHGLAWLGLDAAPLGTLVLRQTLRGPLFGDIELESVVIALGEEDVPDSSFDVPAGFTAVSPPRIRR